MIPTSPRYIRRPLRNRHQPIVTQKWEGNECQVLIKDEWWTLPSHFSFEKLLGSGAYGAVARFYDGKRQRSVAVKRIGDVFRDALDAKRILRELKVLRHLRNRVSIVNVLDVLAPRSPDFDEIYIVLECLESDLHKSMSYRITGDSLRLTIFSLLRAFIVIHKAGILHRDVKPSNILLDRNPLTQELKVKLCDFGLARQKAFKSPLHMCKLTTTPHASPGPLYTHPCRYPTASTDASPSPSSPCMSSAPLTEYVVTRWYRAPEVLLNTGDYDQAVDVWGLGCVIAEMITKQPLFAGTNNDDQIIRICQTLGKPSNGCNILYKTPVDQLSAEARRTRRTFESFPPLPAVPLSTILQKADPDLIDLLSRLLVLDPAARWTAEEAIHHPYFQSFHSFIDVSKDVEGLDIMDWSFDTVPLIKRSIQTKIYEEIIHHWHSEIISRDINRIMHSNIKMSLTCEEPHRRKRSVHDLLKAKEPSSSEVRRAGFLYKMANCISQRFYSTVSSVSSIHSTASSSDKGEADLEAAEIDMTNYVIPINN
eukprot:Blabericola_migrator_1__780@NODE_1195_length_5142_cov_387_875271_g810_i0_p1_GENE_NODE_1195_length_5142_cov_387_875271_g810_i0NODE_1195_length_5142_cov_387_875271_g810_i0_p1_ORF_typecomplete_len537_score94_77Pkinase/PF00069_25/3_7e55Pkinase_Tyr/PF07714_17/3_4e25Kdo/PF06293_14/1_9e13Kinaselike/PF14531_6/2_2e06Pkinase_fungal/PF17667_1/1_6e06Pkinase_fungal/PF17667_1/2_5e03RIO1/PF01163_22/0_00024APH/PF01636_23/0_019APH/PF01636_23/2_9e03WaaY/PF06176_11/0_004WaaY/PF06176_11/3_6e03EcKinase/PF02958_20/0_